ncbi:MAG: phage tail tape measure protein [Filomicrobium sp.]
MAASYSIEYIFLLRDRFSAIARILAMNAKKMHAAVAAAGAALGGLTTRLAAAAAAVGVLAAALVVSAIPAAAKFEDAMANVRRVTDITRQEMLDYGKDALKVGVGVAKSGEAIANIYTQGALMGIRGKDTLKSFADTVAKVSVAWDDISETTAASQLARIQAKFFSSLAPEKATQRIRETADAINELANRSAFKAPELLSGFDRGGAAAFQFGLTPEQTAAYLGSALVLGEPQGFLQGTRMRMTLRRLFESTTKRTRDRKGRLNATGKAFDLLGMTQDQFRGNIASDPIVAVLDLMERMQPLDKFQRQMVTKGLMTERAAAQFSSIAENVNEFKRQLVIADDRMAGMLSRDTKFMEWLRNGSKGHREIADQLERYARISSRVGSVNREFGKRTETVRFAADQLGVSLARIVKLIGLPYLEPLRNFINSLTDISVGLGDWIANNEALATSILDGAMITGLVGMGAMLLKVAAWATGAASGMAALAAIAGTAITFVIAVTGATWLIHNWQAIKDFFDKPHTLKLHWPEMPEGLKRFVDYMSESRDIGRARREDRARAAARAAQTANWSDWWQAWGSGGDNSDTNNRPTKEWFNKMQSLVNGLNVPRLTPPPTVGRFPDGTAVPGPTPNPNRIPQMQVESRVHVENTFQPATVHVQGRLEGLAGIAAKINGSGQLQANRGVASAEAGTSQ